MSYYRLFCVGVRSKSNCWTNRVHRSISKLKTAKDRIKLNYSCLWPSKTLMKVVKSLRRGSEKRVRWKRLKINLVSYWVMKMVRSMMTHMKNCHIAYQLILITAPHCLPHQIRMTRGSRRKIVLTYCWMKPWKPSEQLLYTPINHHDLQLHLLTNESLMPILRWLCYDTKLY